MISDEVLMEAVSRASSEVKVECLSHADQEERDRFVTASPLGTVFHLSQWSAVVEKALGHQCLYLAARGKDGISGILPLSLVRNKFFGDCLVSLPLAVYGGICANDRDSYFALLKAGSTLADRLGVKYLELRNRTEPYPTSLPGRDLYVTFTRDLSCGPEKWLQSLPRDTRYIVRKSLKAGLDWTEDLTLDEFYELYAQSVHRLGTPVFAKKLFRLLRSEFGAKCRIFGVRKGKRAIAGVLCLYFRDQVLPYYAGALQEFYKDSPNTFMYWKLICQSCDEGLGCFDFGRSKKGTGSFDFKNAWAMQVTDLPYQYHLVRATEVPHLSAADQKFELPVALWKRMPFPLTKVLGPQVIRWIPSI